MGEVLPASEVRVVSRRKTINGWPTNSISIDFYRGDDNSKCKPNIILLFIPGNPGLIEWYTDTLFKIVEQLGVGYALRGISYAGHGAGDDVIGSVDEHKQSFVSGKGHQDAVLSAKMSVSWTMEGQIKHKLSWIDEVIEEWKAEFKSSSQSTEELPRLIFISHSFGAYLVQHMLLRRPALLQQTQHILHLMPFIRFDPPPLQKRVLSKLAHSYEYTIPLLSNSVWALSMLPRKLIDIYLNKVVGLDCDKGREITLDVCTHPRMIRNHLILGFEEIRELPELPNDVAFRLIGKACPTSILFCGGHHQDQWAPLHHMQNLEQMKSKAIIHNIQCVYIEELTHDFVVHPKMVEPVIGFCLDQIRHPKLLCSKL